MTDSEVDELRILRNRAYGPAADIHSDPEALQRLRRLEDGESTPQATVTSAPDDEPTGVELSSLDETENHSSAADQPGSPPAERPRVRFRFRPRRSTVLIALAVAFSAAVAMVALTLVQRVQTDPLQVGASQVARLSVDSGFDAPDIAGRRPGKALAYEDFYGTRALVQVPSNDGSNDECLTVYDPALFVERSDGGYSYSGDLMLTGCGAGAFPAAVTFAVTNNSPESLRNTYPVGTALQFVYDRGDDEVVVFQG